MFVPIILLIMLVLVVFSGGTEYNKEIAAYCFSEEILPDTLSAEQQIIIENTRECLLIIDERITRKENDLSINSFDSNRIKAVFLTVQSQIEWNDTAYENFINCFVTEENEYNGGLTSVIEKLNAIFPEAQITSRHIQIVDEIYNYLERNYLNE